VQTNTTESEAEAFAQSMGAVSPHLRLIDAAAVTDPKPWQTDEARVWVQSMANHPLAVDIRHAFRVGPADAFEWCRSQIEAKPGLAHPSVARFAGGSIDVVPEFTDRIRSKLLDCDGLDDLAPPSPLIDGVMFRDSLAVIYGKPGAKKSFVAIDLALCVGTGTWWHGRRVEAGPVLYVMAEGASGIGKRKRAWAAHNNVTARGVTWLPMAVSLLDGDWSEALTIVATELGAVLIVIDTLSRSMPGGDENAARDMTRVIDHADRLRERTGATVALIHHVPRDGSTPRGHSSLEGAVSTKVEVVADGAVVTLKNAKQKDAPEFADVRLTFRLVLDSGVMSGQSVARGDATLDDSDAESSHRVASLLALGTAEPLSASAIVSMLDDLHRATVHRALNALVRRGVVAKVGTKGRPLYEWVGEVGAVNNA